MKILWVDTMSRIGLMKYTIEDLIEAGFEVIECVWYRDETDEWNLRRIIDAAKKADVVVLHFEGRTRVDAARILGKIKETKIKTVYNSASPLLLEEADAVISIPFYTSDLIETLNGFSNQKDSSQ